MAKVKRVAVGLLCTILLASCGMGQGEETSRTTIKAPFDRTGGTITATTKETKPMKELNASYDIENLNYELVWSDEFDTDGIPDPEKWVYDTGGHGWGNNELQYYTASNEDNENPNAWVENGNLVIEARQEQNGSNEFTSARVITKNKGDWLYGRFEIRAKLPEGRGTWPAIWMLPTDWEYGDWPRSGEIDIMEHVGYDQDNIVGTIHTMSYNHSIRTQKGKTIHVEGVSDDFHEYVVEWLPDRIRWFVDGELYNEFSPTDYTDEVTADEWPFDKRHHLLMNIAVGGDWGGVEGVAEDIWPQRFEIDYVRVYQAPEITALIDDDAVEPSATVPEASAEDTTE